MDQIPVDRNRLEQWLNVYWLRPENALWRTLDVIALEGMEVRQPSLDLSCGDGIFSFLLAGGHFGREFDIFQGAGNLDDFYDNADIYDAAPEEYDPTITKRPEYNITVGTDWKPSLLEKADKLNFYDRLIKHDNNKELPFNNNQFNTIYTNSAYWVDNIKLHLKEIARVLDDTGTGIIQLKTQALTNFLDLLYEEYSQYLGSNLIEIIDRGRTDHYAHLYDDTGWEELLSDAGLRVVEKREPWTWVHTRLWDIGLRPISPHLIRMSNSLSDPQREAIKDDWIKSYQEMLTPFVDQNLNFGVPQPPPEIIYVVELCT
jgi:SAM-dependent methyltransferase